MRLMMKTFDYVVPRNGDEFFKSGTFTAAYVDPAKIKLPDNETCKKALKFAKENLDAAVFNHSLRVYIFASILLLTGFPSGTEGIEQASIEEIQSQLFLAALFHDSGTSHAKGTDPAKDAEANMSFEFNGGFVAHRYLNEFRAETHDGAPNPKALGNIIEAIFMHTTRSDTGSCSALVRLMNLCTGFDVLGWDLVPHTRELWNYGSAVETEKLYPRVDLGDVWAGKMSNELGTKPWCLITRLGPKFLDNLRALKTLKDGH